MHSIVLGRSLVDGNKRLGSVAFLEDNGEVLADLVISLAEGELDDVPDLARRLRLLGE